MLYSKNGQYPTTLPFRIRLSNGMTRTNSETFSQEEIKDAGYVLVLDPPTSLKENEKLEWTGTEWKIIIVENNFEIPELPNLTE